MNSTDSTKQGDSLPIAVDVMGGDHGPQVVVEGAVCAAREFGIPSILVGARDQINTHLERFPDRDSLPIEVHHASQVVGMEESPGLAIRGKQDSSVRVAFDLVKQQKASAVVSLGNTGALMAAGVFVAGTLPGIARPAIASIIPKGNSTIPTILLDAGANIGCHAYQLVQFALMGHHYAVSALGCKKPRVALLSNGTELAKGTDVIRSAAMMLGELEDINFIGYVEGRDIAQDVVDVVVCDGFVGNIVLKAVEGCVGLVVDSLKEVASSSIRGKLGMWLARASLKGVLRNKLDPSAYGGAPLLGLGEVAIKCHGSSKERAVMNGIKVAHHFIEQRVLDSLRTSLSVLDTKISSVDMGGSNGVTGALDKKSSQKKTVNREQRLTGEGNGRTK